MESFTIEHLTFTYPNQKTPALTDISLTIEQGQFVALCGKSGCGKTTLLRQLKSALAPFGIKRGRILFEKTPLEEVDLRTQSQKIGFVLQNPDNQIVTDKVWHELAFGLESLGLSTSEIRARVAEMASFFGIQSWFHKKVSELSGGQKQILNLAAIMVMQPSVLILDEPTAQLDPIAALDFLETIAKVHRELGTTILMTEHRLEDVFPLSDRVVVLDEGEVIADGTPYEVGKQLKNLNHDMFVAMPTPMRIFAAVDNPFQCPVTVRDGRKWLDEMAKKFSLNPSLIPQEKERDVTKNLAIEIRDIWFRYEKKLPDVVKDLSMEVYEGEFYAIVGGNGTGKTTTLSIMGGLLHPCRGKVSIGEQYHGSIGILPQNPQALLAKKTVQLDLDEMLKDRKISDHEKEQLVQETSEICELSPFLSRHPYDLSGGEQQRVALAKVLLTNPKILLLDEPTKGLDPHFKETFAAILNHLKKRGVTVVMVSHDIEFCARYADHCALFFDGSIVSSNPPRTFFSGKSFYTTSANRMARGKLPHAVLAEDVILACGGKVTEGRNNTRIGAQLLHNQSPSKNEVQAPQKRKLAPKKMALGCLYALLFVLTAILFSDKGEGIRGFLVNVVLLLELALCLASFSPGNSLESVPSDGQIPKEKRKLSKRTLVAAAIILFSIPLTIYVGISYLEDRKYAFISLLILLQTLLPFALVFESRKPRARELIVISVLCALAVAGRSAFFMLPQFKPVAAIVILAGVCFGGETGFLVGATTGFISNMFFGQGPWTPWQMFAFGIIGFLAGILFAKGWLRKTRASLCVFGGLAVFVIYGGIVNPASVLMWASSPTPAMFITAYSMGLSFDLVHAAATVVFLWFISQPMIEKLDRIKTKYGFMKEWQSPLKNK